MSDLINALRFKKEPIAWITAAVIVAITVYKLTVEKMPVGDILTYEYADYVVALAAGLVARFNVWAPANVPPATSEEVPPAPAGPNDLPEGVTLDDEDELLEREFGAPDENGVYRGDGQ